MEKSRTQLRTELKDIYVKKLSDFLSNDEEVLQVKSNEIAFPVIDSEGNEDFIKITVSIPTGANKGTEPYDAYAEAEAYTLSLQVKAEKAKKSAEAKAKKKERDDKYRAKKAEQKAERENGQ